LGIIDCQIDGWASLGKCSELACRVEIQREFWYCDDDFHRALAKEPLRRLRFDMDAMLTKLLSRRAEKLEF
jgi:hypothetical protein